MQKILNQKHDKHTFTFATSKLLERAAYYGLRSLLVLYMVKASLNIPQEEAFQIYGWFTSAVIFAQILGAVLGDLVLGNKRAVIVGGIVQALGTFVLCIPSMAGLYSGLGLILLGSGMYSPNLSAHFGKLYLNRAQLLDAGFTILYLFINIGALLGTTVISGIGESYGWNPGFMIAGLAMLVSVLLPILSKEQIEIEHQAEPEKLPFNQRFLNVFLGILAGSFFWALYEVISVGNFDIQTNILQTIPMEIPKSIWFTLGSFFSFPILIMVFILWTLFYQNQFVKLSIGFLSGAFSIGILLLIPEASNGMSIIMYLISILFINISEVHIGPIVSSIITKYANPKYLAIIMSLVFLPTRLLMILAGFFSESLEKNPSLGLVIGAIGMGVIGIGIFVYLKIRQKN